MAMTKEVTNAERILLKKIKEETGRECFKCSICGGLFYGFGNNPWPVTDGDLDRCCDACNDSKVIPARLQQMFNNKKKETE